MDQRNTIEKLNKIEMGFDVNTLSCGGIIVWPLVKLYLWNKLLRIESKQPTRNHLRTNGKSKVRGYVSQVCKGLSFLGYLVSRNRIGKQPVLDRCIIDVAFLSRPQDYTDYYRTKLFNKYLDPFLIENNGKYKFLKIENYTFESYRKRDKYFLPHLFTSSSNVFRTLNRPAKNKSKIEIKKIDDLIVFLRDNNFCIDFDKREIGKPIQSIFNYMELFDSILSKINPKLVLVNCFYSSIGFGLILACRNRNIRVADLQHGKGGRFHVMYTNWHRIPDSGYELLPDYFLVWGNEMQRHIHAWQKNVKNIHIPLVVGNLWLSGWIHRGIYEDLTEKQINFFNCMNEYKKTILFTLQPINTPIPWHVMEAIKNSPETWFWLFRTHPRNRDRIESYAQELLNNGCTNFEIEISSNVALYSLLKRVDHHITCWSSVCYEALYFDVPTTIVHENGLQLYVEYIEKGIFSYTIDSKELLRVIQKQSRNMIKKEDEVYIENDLKLFDKVFSKIL